MTAPSINPDEAAFFGNLAADWWDPKGSSAMLHRINPLRLGLIRAAACDRFGRSPRDRAALAGLDALDVGCGAGLVTEPLARMGANVAGIDAAPENIAAARAHAASGLRIDYRATSAEALADSGASFDLVTCLEVIEHVADRASFLTAVAALVRPGGLLVMSTPNRTPLSWATLIVGSERVLKTIPRGAHDWQRFMTPDELTAALGEAGLRVIGTQGLQWRPSTGFALGPDMSVDYFVTAAPA
jgi:2-polyprenyl-6-hydroxyphenyl methylase/3-demethylubiquinone-9 3-methyltransferase